MDLEGGEGWKEAQRRKPVRSEDITILSLNMELLKYTIIASQKVCIPRNQKGSRKARKNKHSVMNQTGNLREKEI